MIRLFVQADLRAGETVQASENQAHYLANVMRRAVGDEVMLFNGRDGEWRSAIAELHRSRARLTPLAQSRRQEAGPDLWLAFAPLKRDATDLVVRQATELGVAALLPVLTERTNAARVNGERLAAIALEAAEQSERLTLPAIHPAVSLPALLEGWQAGRVLAACIERAAPCPIPRAGALLTGPEGGFAPAEVDALRAASFMSPIHLGPRILRAETAAAAGLALLQGARWSTN